MKKILNKFSIIGTNPSKYIDNFFNYINPYEQLSKFDIILNKIEYYNNLVFEFNSSTTFRQNLECWDALGLIKKNKTSFTKIVPDFKSYDELLDYIKFSILIDTNNESTNIYRNTIIIKLLYLIDSSILDNKTFTTRLNKTITFSDIEHEIGKFEQNIIKDKKYVEIIKILWGKNNE